MQKTIEAIRQFNRFYTNFLGLLNENLLDHPITLTEGRILFEIRWLPDCNAAKLIEFLNLDRGYISRVLKRLEGIGLIEQVEDPQDRRVKLLKLTEDGTRMMRRIDANASDQVKDVLEPLGLAEREKLVKAMRDIKNILSKLSMGTNSGES